MAEKNISRLADESDVLLLDGSPNSSSVFADRSDQCSVDLPIKKKTFQRLLSIRVNDLKSDQVQNCYCLHVTLFSCLVHF